MSHSHIWILLANKIANASRASPNSDQSKPSLNLEVSTTSERSNNRIASFEMNSLFATVSATPSIATSSYLMRQMDCFLKNNSSSLYPNGSPPISPYSSGILSGSSAYGPLDMARMVAYDPPTSARPSERSGFSEMNPVKVEKIVSDIGKLPDKRGYRCMYCDHVYSRKYGLRIHIRTHTGYKPLQCNICNRSFSDPSNFNKHERLHAAHKSRYNCVICNRILVRKRDLERHMQAKHSDENNDKITDSSAARSTPRHRRDVRR
jgi:hypothetical protein